MFFESALSWTILNLITLSMLGFYSMQEMACVSFNKIRLQYYVSKGIKSAIWLNALLKNPSILFGTTLFCVNAAMFIGSECARETYIALGLSPDWAPLTQVALVVIFGELAPMFAARRYAEHVAMLGAPILYATSILLTPILWTINFISKIVDFLIGGSKSVDHIILNQDELQKILALQDDEITSDADGEDLNDISRNIFSLRNKEARQIMQPMQSISVLPANALVSQARSLFKNLELEFIALYHRDSGHIVGILQPRDLIRAPDSKRVRELSTAPWFITQNSKALNILKDFRRSKKSVAIVLNAVGTAVGVITLEDVIQEIFGKMDIKRSKSRKKEPQLLIDRTFSGDMTVAEFNAEFGVTLSKDVDLTLAELMEQTLGHHPEIDEEVYLDPFELKVKETSLTEVKKVGISTRIT